MVNMLQGKTAVVTGAAKGIGKAIALAFAKEGCNIVLNYHSSLDDETVQEIEACGVTCMPVQGDVSDFAFAADMMKKVNWYQIPYFIIKIAVWIFVLPN